MNRYLGMNTESVDSVLVSVCSLSSIDQCQSCLSGLGCMQVNGAHGEQERPKALAEMHL